MICLLLTCNSYYYNSNPAPTSLFLIPSFTSGCVTALGMLCLVTNRNKYIGILMAPRTGLVLSAGGLAAGEHESSLPGAKFVLHRSLVKSNVCVHTDFSSWRRSCLVSFGIWASLQRILECNSICRFFRHGFGVFRPGAATA